ncbi:MAG: cyclase family protein [[Mycobacterium] stephanolepidis]
MLDPFSALNIVNLSHVFDPANINIFPGDPPYEVSTVATIEEHGYFLQRVSCAEHTGTHWGAPSHFNAGQPSVDQLDPNDLLLPAVKLDIREKTAENSDYAVTVEDLVSWEKLHGPIPSQSAIILWTGWDQRWGTADYYNFDSDLVMHHPGFSIEALEWLIDNGRLGRRGALGTDAFSPDIGIDETYAVSKLLYREHRISLEILANLHQIPTRDFHILAGGATHKNGSGTPANIYAMVTN